MRNLAAALAITLSLAHAAFGQAAFRNADQTPYAPQASAMLAPANAAVSNTDLAAAYQLCLAHSVMDPQPPIPMAPGAPLPKFYSWDATAKAGKCKKIEREVEARVRAANDANTTASGDGAAIGSVSSKLGN